MEDDPGAELLGVGDLEVRSVLRHHDGRVDAEPPCVMGNRLGVIAGRHGNHTGPAFGFGQRLEADQRAALLERAGELKHFELEIQLRAGDVGKGAGMDERRLHDRALDGALGALNIFESDGHFSGTRFSNPTAPSSASLRAEGMRT